MICRVFARLALLAVVSTAAACSAESDAASDGDGETVTAAASRSPEYELWAKVVRDAGSPLHRNGRATVVGLRGTSLDGERHAVSSFRAYDDLLVVLRADGTVLRLPLSTHPFERKGVSGVPDVDGDGSRDVGMIRPGLYEATGRGDGRFIAGHAAFDVRVAASGPRLLPGFRDTNHDGVFDEIERAASVARSDVLSAVLFHTGDGSAPPAVGCQVLPAGAMDDFVRAVGGSNATFDYVLVDTE